MTRNQSGFVFGVIIVIMVLGATAFFGLYAKNWLFQNQDQTRLTALHQLNDVKQQLLKYAQFQPELYLSDLHSNTRTYKESEKIPGLGYLPCPDLDGDGSVLEAETSCGNPRNISDDTTGFVYGFLPIGFTTRNIFFGGLQPKQFYYVVDERFVNGNNAYNNGSTGRYAPLNPSLSPAQAPDSGSSVLPDGTPPWIDLNGREGYVALIIFPNAVQVFPDGYAQDRTQAGNAQDRIGDYLDRRYDESGARVNGNADGDRFFFSESNANIGVNDLVVGITLDEWRESMLGRLCSQQQRLAEVPLESAYWLNDYDAEDNPSGSGWRAWLGECS